MLRIAVASARPRLRRLRMALGDYLYAGYVLALVGVLAIPFWLGMVLPPVRSWRWRAARGIIRLLLAGAGVPVAVRGLANLPPPGRPCVFVSNHMSYMDGGLLAAFLLREVRIVVKAKLRNHWITRLPLGRVGVEYVERFDRRKGIDDADRRPRPETHTRHRRPHSLDHGGCKFLIRARYCRRWRNGV